MEDSIDMSIAVAGGKTGGHFFPALAVAQTLRRLESRVKVYMIGSKHGMDSRLAPEAGFDYYSIPAIPLKRGLSARNLAIPFVLAYGAACAILLFKRTRTKAVFATGGFICVPVLIAARLTGIKTFLQEQNSFPGITTKLFAKRANAVFAAHSEVSQRLHPRSNVVCTGNPLRPGFEIGSRSEGVKYFGLDPSAKTIFVLGGSQGAEAINSYIASNLERLRSANGVQLLWQTGRGSMDKYSQAFRNSRVPGTVLPFIDRMDLAYACADVAICRAGAMTLAELAAAGTPSVLIPYPYATENHQEYNAKVVAEKGAAIVVRQNEMVTSDALGKALSLTADENTRKAMSDKARSLHTPDAAENIASSILKGISS